MSLPLKGQGRIVPGIPVKFFLFARYVAKKPSSYLGVQWMEDLVLYFTSN